MNDTRYFYANESDQPVGPFTLAELQKMRQQGFLPADTRACPDGGSEWVSLASLNPGPSPSPTVPATPGNVPKATVQVGQADEAPVSKAERNAVPSAVASILLPCLSIYFLLPDHIKAPFFYLSRTQPLHLMLIAAIAVLGLINARNTLRVPGHRLRRPIVHTAARIGVVLFMVSMLILTSAVLMM